MLNKSNRSRLAVAVVAFGALWAAQTANAHTDVSLSIGVPIQAARSTPVLPAYEIT